jgi:DNA (cytosine-5)-methyltransferase 1
MTFDDSTLSDGDDTRASPISSANPDTQKDLVPILCSFFAGAGFLDLGFEKAGFEIGYVNEVSAPFVEAYKFSRDKMNLASPTYGYFEGDIGLCLNGDEAERLSKMIKAEHEKGRLVGFVGGPPCPDFSVGGKNKGEHGNNGILSKTYVDIIIDQQPDFFIFENVKGLYRTSKHREFFNSLKDKLKKSGYLCTEQIINALYYGVPQDRERIILFGTNNKILKEKINLFNWKKHQNHMFAKDARWPDVSNTKSSSPNLAEGAVDLTVQHWFDKNSVINHPNAEHQFKPRAGLTKFQTIREGDDSKKSYKRLHRWRYSPTAAYGNNEVHIHPTSPRRISVAEALAIQSMPKEFCLPPNMTLTNMFKTVGNGVPYLAAYGIALTVMDFLRDANDEADSK